MLIRNTKAHYPFNEKSIKIIEKDYPNQENNTIYQSIELFKEFIKNTEQSNVINIKNNIEIRKIINLHNSEGIKDLEQIKSMITTIKSGNHIISENIPNIKLLKNSDELILFDGHHSMLAYLYSNITSLHQIPHIIIENKNQPLTNKDINVFFGNHKEKLQNQDWRQFAINWQAPIEKQLSKRIHNNMGELFESIKENLS